MKFCLFVIFFGFLNFYCSHLHAQNYLIQARVIDISNLEPVSFSTIIFSETEGTITDNSGFFQYRLDPSKTYDSIKVSCIGYNSKMFAIRELTYSYVDTLLLRPALAEIGEVQITERRKREESGEKIINNALSKISKNYQDQTSQITGYYREYLKYNQDYVNLLESIIQIDDPGFLEKDEFNVHLNYKRLNTDFYIDSSLLELYNANTKFVPFGMIPDVSANNINILRFADPVRNYNRSSISHFNVFQEDFITNHIFNPRELIYMDDEPYFKIDFTDGKFFTYEYVKVRMIGTIYINADDYGIKKIRYKAVLDHGLTKEVLFEINLEYIKINGKYNLHYISHNNLFKHKNFALEESELKKGRLLLCFTRKPDPAHALNPENYIIKAKGYDQIIDSIRQDGDSIMISFNERSLIARNIPEDYPFFRIFKRREVKKQYKEIKEDLSIELKSYSDVQGSPLASSKYSDFYQYREFFVKERTTEFTPSSENLMDLSVPIIYNPVAGENTPDTSWINTPLVSETLRNTKTFSPIPIQNTHIKYNYKKLISGINDLAYITTDRELYAPEDTIWFKAYLRNKIYLTPSNSSSAFYIHLVDNKGTIVNSGKYLLRGGEILGEFKLDHKLKPGIYTLVGYSSWMKNFKVNELFSKKILVKNEKRSGTHVFVACDRIEYFPGDTVAVEIHVKDEFNRELYDVAFSYELRTNENSIIKGKGNTTESSMNPLLLELPANLESIPDLIIKANYNSHKLDTSFVIPASTEISVSFYPEGGHLIKGIKSKIALKSFSNKGSAIAIKAKVIDSKGKLVTEVSTGKNGMGLFEYSALQGRKCRLEILSPLPNKDTIYLPSGIDKGMILSVTKDNKKLVADIEHNFDYSKTVLFCITVRDALAYYDVVEVVNKTRIQIPFDEIPAGVAVLTIFDEMMLPQAERLVFVPPNAVYKAEIDTYRQTYQPRDSVELKIRIRSNSSLHKGSYSLAVVDDYMGFTREVDEPNIVSCYLFSPEIRGRIDNPNLYSDFNDPNTAHNTELLLLTQGWRDYSMNYSVIPQPVNRDAIYGKIMKVPFGRELEPVEGEVDIYFAGTTSKINTEKNGFFTFYPAFTPEHNTEIFISATDKRGNKNVSIILDSSQFERDLENYLALLSNKNKIQEQAVPETYSSFSDHFSYGIENHQWLEEVVIRKTIVSKDKELIDFSLSKRSATEDQLKLAIDIEQLQDLMHVRNRYDSQVWYVLDGILQSLWVSDESGQNPPVEMPDSTLIDVIDPKNIESFTIIEGPEAEALYGLGKLYVIDIATRSQDVRALSSRKHNPITLDKYTVSKRFYSPSYSTQFKLDNPFPDLRKTLYWNPRVPIDENGFARVVFYNGDRYTRIRCTFEGMSTNGIPIHSEHTYDIGITRE